jgi:hypothetical protein
VHIVIILKVIGIIFVNYLNRKGENFERRSG